MNDARRAQLVELAARCGTPSYVYFLDDARERVRALTAAFDGAFEVSFAVKANPAHEVLRGLRGHAAALDVSSGGELRRAVAAGFEPHRISFTGPGKSAAELQLSIDLRIGEVVLESIEEARVLDALARAAGHVQRVLVRIAPDTVPPGFGDTMSGKPVAFGIDEEDLSDFLAELRRLDALRLAGFHAYSGTQCLRADSIVANWTKFADVFAHATSVAGIRPECLVFGSGLGIPYHPDQQALSLDAVAEGARALVARLRTEFVGARLLLETGRYVIGEAGYLLTRVLRTKDSRGMRIGICDSGLHHHLAAAGLFGMIVRRDYRMQNLNADPAAAPSGPFQLSGPLCTSIDVLGRKATFPSLTAGDVIAIEVSGAYGATASPSAFISHPPVREWVVDGADVRDANGAETGTAT